MFLDVNVLAVLVVALLAVAIGSIWYSPLLCGKVWMQALGKSDLEVDFSKREMIGVTVRAVLINVLFFGILAWLSAVLFVGKSPVTIGLTIFGIAITHLALIALWEKRPLSYLLVHAGYTALVLFGGLSVIMYWPW